MLNSRKRITILFLAVNLGILAISLIYALVFTLCPELFACAFKESLHIYCPGCGGSRAVTRLLSLDIIGSFICFPPLYFAIGAIMELDIKMLISIIRNDAELLRRYRPTAFIIFGAVLIIHFILRNVLLVGFGIDTLGDILGSTPFRL